MHRDITHAADKLNNDNEQIKFEILVCADCNKLCRHVGIGRMIEECKCQELGTQICKDLRYLSPSFFQGNPHEQIRMRTCIKALERE